MNFAPGTLCFLRKPLALSCSPAPLGGGTQNAHRATQLEQSKMWLCNVVSALSGQHFKVRFLTYHILRCRHGVDCYHPRGVFCFVYYLFSVLLFVGHCVQRYFLLFRFFPAIFFSPLFIVQVPRITSVWPRTPFRPLFSTIQAASLLSSHPFEAAMFGVAGAMYYLCERAFTSRWKSAKVGLFLLVLGTTWLCTVSTVML